VKIIFLGTFFLIVQIAAGIDKPCGGASGSAHPNGGGFVASTANVSASAFVGKDASVCEYAIVSDRSRIIDTATISGHAQISGSSSVEGNSTVNGKMSISNSTINFAPSDHEIERRRQELLAQRSDKKLPQEVPIVQKTPWVQSKLSPKTTVEAPKNAEPEKSTANPKSVTFHPGLDIPCGTPRERQGKQKIDINYWTIKRVEGGTVFLNFGTFLRFPCEKFRDSVYAISSVGQFVPLTFKGIHFPEALRTIGAACDCWEYSPEGLCREFTPSNDIPSPSCAYEGEYSFDKKNTLTPGSVAVHIDNISKAKFLKIDDANIDNRSKSFPEIESRKIYASQSAKDFGEYMYFSNKTEQDIVVPDRFDLRLYDSVNGEKEYMDGEDDYYGQNDPYFNHYLSAIGDHLFFGGQVIAYDKSICFTGVPDWRDEKPATPPRLLDFQGKLLLDERTLYIFNSFNDGLHIHLLFDPKLNRYGNFVSYYDFCAADAWWPEQKAAEVTVNVSAQAPHCDGKKPEFSVWTVKKVSGNKAYLDLGGGLGFLCHEYKESIYTLGTDGKIVPLTFKKIITPKFIKLREGLDNDKSKDCACGSLNKEGICEWFTGKKVSATRTTELANATCRYEGEYEFAAEKKVAPYAAAVYIKDLSKVKLEKLKDVKLVASSSEFSILKKKKIYDSAEDISKGHYYSVLPDPKCPDVSCDKFFIKYPGSEESFPNFSVNMIGDYIFLREAIVQGDRAICSFHTNTGDGESGEIQPRGQAKLTIDNNELYLLYLNPFYEAQQMIFNATTKKFVFPDNESTYCDSEKWVQGKAKPE